MVNTSNQRFSHPFKPNIPLHVKRYKVSPWRHAFLFVLINLSPESYIYKKKESKSLMRDLDSLLAHTSLYVVACSN
ncbi:protein of unknown function [Paenibacillus alvei]|uniref:Uncharacterized protein n=1 Tax=Paenibacillus alvei TaxID=44250 RepID=A0A383RIP4_PAEAL|nr:protein of unknown function [Paenibacillus alvei]